MKKQTINTTPTPITPMQSAHNVLGIKRYNMAAYFNNQFFRDIESFRKNGRIQSGYVNLDAITNLYPGLYILGAISSLGKTTFVHQMADQMAEADNHILLFSLEQSVLELASKSVARIISKENPEDVLSSLQVRRGNPSDPRITSAINKYKTFSDKITIIECSFRATIDNIINTVTAYIDQYKVKPVVIIDYLQVIQATPESHTTTKDTVDYHVRRLKELQADHQLTMIVISSLNRQNYISAIDFESFKESGGIEYTADVIWGLQLQCLHEQLFSNQNKINQKRQRIKDAKRESPRKIELVCLKNRFGISSYTCQFNYYPVCDLFEPDLTGINMDKISDSSTDTDGWMTIPKDLEHEIPWDIE